MWDKLINIFLAGGPMMGVITASAFFAMLVFIERFLYLHKAHNKAVDFIEGIKTPLKKGRLTEAIALCEETPCPLSRVIKAGLVNISQPRNILERSMVSAGLLELPLLQRRVSSIMLVAKIAPIMGLLGTVIALLEIFRVAGESASYLSSSELLAQVYNAMLSTCAGLMLCLCAVAAYSLLIGRVRAIAHDIDWATNDLMLFIERGMPEKESLKISPETKEDGQP